MKSFKEQYWRYSLFVLIIGLGVTIFVQLTPLIGGLLGAATIYILLRRQMHRLTQVHHWRRSLAASLLLVEAIIIFLIPISLIVWMFVAKIQHIALNPQSIVQPIRDLASTIYEKTGYNPLQEGNLNELIALIPKLGQWVLRSIFDFGINLVTLLFVLYFMLIGGYKMEAYCRDMLPFNYVTSKDVLREVHMIVRSNAIGVPLLAVVQGSIAFVAYVIFKAPSPIFWGVLTCLATIIPIVGTALIWVPLGIYLGLSGHWGNAIGLLLFGTIVITHVDNVARLMMQKKMADIHPLITIFGVIIGLSLFGFMGVIFGPLMLALFIFFVHIFKRKYLDGSNDKELFIPSASDPGSAAGTIIDPQS